MNYPVNSCSQSIVNAFICLSNYYLVFNSLIPLRIHPCIDPSRNKCFIFLNCSDISLSIYQLFPRKLIHSVAPTLFHTSIIPLHKLTKKNLFKRRFQNTMQCTLFIKKQKLFDLKKTNIKYLKQHPCIHASMHPLLIHSQTHLMTYASSHKKKWYIHLCIPPQVISLEGWVDIMYYVQDTHSFWDWVYFVTLIVVSLRWMSKYYWE